MPVCGCRKCTARTQRRKCNCIQQALELHLHRCSAGNATLDGVAGNAAPRPHGIALQGRVGGVAGNAALRPTLNRIARALCRKCSSEPSLNLIARMQCRKCNSEPLLHRIARMQCRKCSSKPSPNCIAKMQCRKCSSELSLHRIARMQCRKCSSKPSLNCIARMQCRKCSSEPLLHRIARTWRRKCKPEQLQTLIELSCKDWRCRKCIARTGGAGNALQTDKNRTKSPPPRNKKPFSNPFC